jgi:hypothetical protein
MGWFDTTNPDFTKGVGTQNSSKCRAGLFRSLIPQTGQNVLYFRHLLEFFYLARVYCQAFTV